MVIRGNIELSGDEWHGKREREAEGVDIYYSGLIAGWIVRGLVVDRFNGGVTELGE